MSGGTDRKKLSLEFADTADLFLDADALSTDSPSSTAMGLLRQVSSNTQHMASLENSYADGEFPMREAGEPQAPVLVAPRATAPAFPLPVARPLTPIEKSATWIAEIEHPSEVPPANIMNVSVPPINGGHSPSAPVFPHSPLEQPPTDDREQTPPKSPLRRSPLTRQAAVEFEFPTGDNLQVQCEPARRRRKSFLKQISRNLISGNQMDPEFQQESCSSVLSYIHRTSGDVKTMVANYLSTGKLESLQVTHENFHHILHVATSLSLQQLKDHCMEFCFENNHIEILSLLQECEGTCKHDVEHEAETGFQRTQSVLSDRDDGPPEYYIVFSREDSAKKKARVIVIDMSERLDIFHREMEKPYQFGPGFACCSMTLEDAPYVFVSGGEGKHLNNLWKYDVLLCKWTKCAKMYHGRSYHVMVTIKDKLYVVGGVEVPCIEEYNPRTNKWHECGSLTTHVYNTACAVHHNKLYLLGGRTPAGAVASLQTFDVTSRTVQKLSDLPVGSYGGAAVTIGNHMFYASSQGHMTCLDTGSGISHLCSKQPLRRKHFGVFVKNERLYFIGGILRDEEEDGENHPQYRYNPVKDSWVEKKKLSKCFPVYASCIVKYPQKCPVIPFVQPF